MCRRGIGIQAAYELELLVWYKPVLVFHYEYIVLINCRSEHFQGLVSEIVHIDSRTDCTKL